MSEWQPIETAPKDGTYIIGTKQNGWALGKYRWDAVRHGGCWVDTEYGECVEITYWMPLP